MILVISEGSICALWLVGFLPLCLSLAFVHAALSPADQLCAPASWLLARFGQGRHLKMRQEEREDRAFLSCSLPAPGYII